MSRRIRARAARLSVATGTSRCPHQDRELLAELIQARLALRRYAVNLNVNQIAAALNSGGQAPVWAAGRDRRG
mgnify:CR=1 FL=1